MSTQHSQSDSGSGLSSSKGESGLARKPHLNAGVNPLYGSKIKQGGGGGRASTKQTSYMDSNKTTKLDERAAGGGGGSKRRSVSEGGAGSKPRRAVGGNNKSSSNAQRNRTAARGGSPQSTVTTSTMQSSTSSRPDRQAASAGANNKKGLGTSKPSSIKGSSSKESSGSESMSHPRKGARVAGHEPSNEGPPTLVPALMAPVPPPPRKRKLRRSADIETGHAEEASVMEDAPDKTIMEMMQTYFKKQDLYTRISLIVLLLVLAGGVFGAYVVLLVYAIRDHNVKYIVLISVFSVVFFWVLWKYCFSGDEKLQDQSAIAQDIANLYAEMPDHTALRGVSEKGRAQFTDFKYEKSEMMFTAVTDDGVSLGSERGSELMMDGADPACPLCNKAYVEGADLCLLPCLHVFHKTCINKWCNRHIVCPLCKRHLEAPEPIHSLGPPLPAMTRGQSEPGRNHGAAQRSGTWRNMLGDGPAGPASGHGSERGLGGTRSDDGLWNDRVLNAAQQQRRGHNRVTSFSSETRRANGGRGRPETRGAGRGGPPKSGSAGAGVGTGAPGKRSASVGHAVGGSGGGSTHRGTVQRKRSSSFTTSSERPRGGSGRVAHGTRAARGGPGARPSEGGSPRSRSDLGLGTLESDRARNTSDAILSRHAARHASTGAMKKMFDDNSVGPNGERNGRNEQGKKMAAGTGSAWRKGAQSQGQGPAVITVRKVKAGVNKTVTGLGGGGGGRSQRLASRESGRSGGESETDGSSSRKSSSVVEFRRRSTGGDGGGGGGIGSTDADSDGSPETRTKALSYGPRKPRVSAGRSVKTGPSSFSGKGPGHRRAASTGTPSASAGEYAASTRKPRRRVVPGSKSGSGGHAAAAAAAAAAEAVNRLRKRPAQDKSTSASSSAPSSRPTGGALRATQSVANASGNSSGGESSSDGRVMRVSRPRRSSKSSTAPPPAASAATAAATAAVPSTRRNTNPATKTTPTKVGSVTKGTPAPPMAAARATSWGNSNTSVPSAHPVIDASASGETEPPSVTYSASRELQTEGTTPGVGETGIAGSGTAEMVGTDSASNFNSSRGWNLRFPSAAGNAEFFGLGSNSGGTMGSSVEGDGSGASSGGGGDGGRADVGRVSMGSTSGGKSLASKVFRSGNGGRKSTGRLFGSGTGSARTGKAPMGCTTDSDDERTTEASSEGPSKSIATGALQHFKNLRSNNKSTVDGDLSISEGLLLRGNRRDFDGNREDTFAFVHGEDFVTDEPFASRNANEELIKTYEKPRCDSDENLHQSNENRSSDERTMSGSETVTKIRGRTFQSRRRASGNHGSNGSVGEMLTAGAGDSDDEHYERPKLSYKKPTRHARRSTPPHPTADNEQVHEIGLDEVPVLNPDGEDWGEEEPYARPKLSYGGGLFSTSKRGGSFPFDSKSDGGLFASSNLGNPLG